MKTINTSAAPAAIGPYSQAVASCGFLFCSGQIPIDPDTGKFVSGGITEQTEQVIKNIKAVLSAAGLEISDVVKSVCFLKDMEHFSKFNEVYAKHFTHAPARSCVAAAALPKDALVEIEVTAQLK